MKGRKYTEQLFWKNIDMSAGFNACWPWLGTISPSGYGYFFTSGKRTRAHRAAWELSNALSIPQGLMVLHSCDNRRCCNPSHLRVGDQYDNMRDRSTRGRAPTGNKNGAVKYPERIGEGVKRVIAERGMPLVFGARHGMAKLTDEDVHSIVREYKNNHITQRELAARYGISQRQIGRIVRGHGWKHLTGMAA